VGKAVAAWAGGGAEVTKASVARYYREALERGRRVADAFSSAARAGARTTRATTAGVRRFADALWFARKARRAGKRIRRP
jgi:hypothetical protein